MEYQKFKPLIILGLIMGILLILLFVINMSNKSNDGNTLNKNKNNNKSNIVYKKVTDSAEKILSNVYNSDGDYYTGFTSDINESENIFGNKQEKIATTYSQKTKMAITLNSFKINNMSKISCNSIRWNSNWKNSKCGSQLGDTAYYITVQEFNKKAESIFNERIDYSKLNTDDLTIGTCTGNSSNNYVFRYIKDKSIFVSTKKTGSCINNGKLEVTGVEKTQDKDLLTLIVYYTKTKAYNLNDRVTYGDEQSFIDKFFFKVKEDGNYYFYSSTLFNNE